MPGRYRIESEAVNFRVSIHEIDRLDDSTDWIDVDSDFVQRERTPERIVDVSI